VEYGLARIRARPFRYSEPDRGEASLASTYLYNLPYIICEVLAFVPAIVLHEMSHGFAAYKLGDPTAKRAGRLSFNPLKHIDPFGTVIMPLLLLAMNAPVFGYAKPVPYDPRYFKNPRRDDLIVGLAGPLSNILMALVGSVCIHLVRTAAGVPALMAGGAAFYVYLFFQVFTLINLYLAFFNLIPIPPLDGSSIFAFFTPEKHLSTYYRIQRYAFPIFFIVVIILPEIIHFDPVGWYLQVTAGNLFDVLARW
jgi:Zn-dependent protease